MSQKAECPGCDAYSSTVLHAFENDDPCPFCGLSAPAAAEVEGIRKVRAEEGLKARLEEALVRADRAEAEASLLRTKLQAVQWAIEKNPNE